MFTQKREVKIMQGNEAVAYAALQAGCNFFAGYPITPSTEIAEILSVELPKIGGKFIQMEDELASMGAIIGASLAGSKTLTSTSGPGYSLMQENLGFAIMTEVPCVIVNVQRGGPSTGLPTKPAQGDVMQARWGTHGDHPIIVLTASSVQEAYFATIKAFNLAEKYRIPVILLLDEVVGHMREKIEIPRDGEIEVTNRVKSNIPPEWFRPYRTDANLIPLLPDMGTGYRYHVTGLTHDETGFPTSNNSDAKNLLKRLHKKLTRNYHDIVMVDKIDLKDAEIAVFAYGCTARSAEEAIAMARSKGIKVGLFKPYTIWPFPFKDLEALTNKVHTIIVPELNLGQLQGEVKKVVRNKVKVIGIHRIDGELITPEKIFKKIKNSVKN